MNYIQIQGFNLNVIESYKNKPPSCVVSTLAPGDGIDPPITSICLFHILSSFNTPSDGDNSR